MEVMLEIDGTFAVMLLRREWSRGMGASVRPRRLFLTLQVLVPATPTTLERSTSTRVGVYSRGGSNTVMQSASLALSKSLKRGALLHMLSMSVRYLLARSSVGVKSVMWMPMPLVVMPLLPSLSIHTHLGM